MGASSIGIVAGIVFEVGVLDEDDFAGGLRQAGADACALALVLVVQRELHGVRAIASQYVLEIGLLQKFAGAVGGEVIDDDDLFAQSDRLAGDLLEELHHGLPFVEDRNDDGESVELRSARVVSRHGEAGWRLSNAGSRTDLREQIDSEDQQYRIDGMPITRMRETYIVNQRIKDNQAGEEEDAVNAIADGEDEPPKRAGKWRGRRVGCQAR